VAPDRPGDATADGVISCEARNLALKAHHCKIPRRCGRNNRLDAFFRVLIGCGPAYVLAQITLSHGSFARCPPGRRLEIDRSANRTGVRPRWRSMRGSMAAGQRRCRKDWRGRATVRVRRSTGASGTARLTKRTRIVTNNYPHDTTLSPWPSTKIGVHDYYQRIGIVFYAQRRRRWTD